MKTRLRMSDVECVHLEPNVQGKLMCVCGPH